MPAHVHTHMHTYTQMHARTHPHTHTDAHTKHTQHTYTHTLNTHTQHTHSTHTFTHTHTQNQQQEMGSANLNNDRKPCVFFRTTVTRIENQLPPESQSLWKQRGNVDHIVMLDWRSKLETLDIGTTLRTLKDALFKVTVVFLLSVLCSEGLF